MMNKFRNRSKRQELRFKLYNRNPHCYFCGGLTTFINFSKEIQPQNCSDNVALLHDLSVENISVIVCKSCKLQNTQEVIQNSEYLSDLFIAKAYIKKQKDAQQRNIKFNLSFIGFRNLMRAKKCYYSGIILTHSMGPNQLPTDRTIDRLDCLKGYERGNCVASSALVNHWKGDLEGMRISLKLTPDQIIKKTKEHFRKRGDAP